MNPHWLLSGSAMLLAVTVESVQLMRNARRKRRAHELRARAIAAQGCRTSVALPVGHDPIATCDSDTTLSMKQHVRTSD
jgi:hypothetical protein